jgi:hypothetical protein
MTWPELDELLRLLATAAEHDEVLATVLKLKASTGFVFSLDPTCSTPLRPSCSLDVCAHCVKSSARPAAASMPQSSPPAKVDNERTDGRRFNTAAVSGRQDRTVQVMLHHYSTGRHSADTAGTTNPRPRGDPVVDVVADGLTED